MDQEDPEELREETINTVAFRLTWAIFWRLTLLYLVIGIVSQFLEEVVTDPLVVYILNLILFLGAMFLVIKHLMVSGFNSYKLSVVDKEDAY